jgi:hypothetical protein
VPDSTLLCAACIASSDGRQQAAWTSRWAVTIYRGNALCMDHYEEIRKADVTKAAKKAAAK